MTLPHLKISGMLMLACFAACVWALSDTGGGSALAAGASKAGTLRVYVGTYTRGDSKGIYRFRMDLATGALTAEGTAAESVNPSFLALHPSHRFLYAVNEVGEFQGKQSGAVSAFAVDPDSGELTLLNQQPSGGAAPCHLVVDRSGQTVLVANYSGGSVAALPIGKDGRLGDANTFIQHTGTSILVPRQQSPHAHSINLDAANHFAVAADLGLDKVLVYRFDVAKGTLAPGPAPLVSVKPGAGPRHFDFHPNGRFAYVINEIDSTVTALSYDAGRGELKRLHTLPTLPAGFEGNNSTADVHVHPTGKFLYGSNRGHNSIVIFSIDAKTGRLTHVGHQSTQGSTPRNFGIDPTGTYLLAANEATGTIVVFRIDPKTGKLQPTGNVTSVPSPVCVKMIRISD